MNIKEFSGVALAAFIAAAPHTAAAQAQTHGKNEITIGEYCSRQDSEENQAELHLANSPYKNSFVDVPVQSSVHGNIVLNQFNCESLIPICSTRGFAATKGSLSAIHLSLGAYNDSDDPVIVESIRALGNNIEVLDAEFTKKSQTVKHLESPSPGHGLDLFNHDNGTFDIGDTSNAIYGACAAQLRR